MILHSYRVACDACDFVSREFPTALALDVYLLGDHEPDGKWLVTRRRRICAGCVIDRACRIFGHRIVPLPYALDHSGRSTCTRCHTFQAVA